MDKREQIIEALEMSYRFSNVDENNTLVPQEIVLDIIALLKAQTRTIEQFEREREQQMWDMPPMGGFHDD